MQIAVFSEKGGVGKTTVAKELALNFDATIVELDPYGVLTQTLEEDRVVRFELNEKVPDITDGDVIYDFGGFDDKRFYKIGSQADLIIIPFNPTINALGTTINSYIKAKECDTPILLVANSVLKPQDAIDAFEFLSENLEEELITFSIPHTRAIQTAENECLSVKQLANSNGLRKHTYKKINKIMEDFHELVAEFQ
jgi:cellulose biosynthesis protein BcsQ